MKATVLDALAAGFDVDRARRRVAAVDVAARATASARCEEMARAGAQIAQRMGQGGLEPPSNRL